MISHLQATLPVYIDESGSTGTIAANGLGSVTVGPKRDTYFRVTGLYVSVPLNVTVASISLGDQTIPLQNTTTLLSPIQKILDSRQVITLTFTCGSANGGVGYVWAWGEAIPSYGKLGM